MIQVRREVKQFIEQPAITKNRTLLVRFCSNISIDVHCLLHGNILWCDLCILVICACKLTITICLTLTILSLVCLQEFEELCSEEQQLKASFSQFVSAYEKACNGLNTLQHQLGVKNKFIRERGRYESVIQNHQ